MSMENNVEVTVIIYTVKLSLPKEKLEDMYDDNPILGIIANKVKVSLEKEDIEVWGVDRNILITEEGYKVISFPVDEEKI